MGLIQGGAAKSMIVDHVWTTRLRPVSKGKETHA